MRLFIFLLLLIVVLWGCTESSSPADATWELPAQDTTAYGYCILAWVDPEVGVQCAAGGSSGYRQCEESAAADTNVYWHLWIAVPQKE